MKPEDISHLAALARLRLSPEELASFTAELPQILAYVGMVTTIAGDRSVTGPQVGPLHNVFRSDVITNAPEAYTEQILAELPARHGRFMKVKKILTVDE